MTSVPFWKTKSLADMTAAEWESLCDGCGRCCLHKLQDEETDEVTPTSVACRLLDTETCRCTNYAERKRLVPDCLVLKPDQVGDLPWLPATCAYRQVAEGRALEAWHPLISGTRESVMDAGISVAGRIVSEREAGPLEHYMVDWDWSRRS